MTRICGNHLHGNIGSSTFRKTISAVLAETLGLRVTGVGILDRTSNLEVSSWMERHLRVSIAPVGDRATLAGIERAVLRRLDPPLNLMGMTPTPVRRELRQLRSALGTAAVGQPSATGVRSPAASRAKARGRLTLHDAMVKVLQDVDWLTFQDLADQIAQSGFYTKGDGAFASPAQLRMRATLSEGRYVDLFQVEAGRIRLRPH